MPGIRHEGLRQLLDGRIVRPGSGQRRIIAQLAPFPADDHELVGHEVLAEPAEFFRFRERLGNPVRYFVRVALDRVLGLQKQVRYQRPESRSGSTTNSAKNGFLSFGLAMPMLGLMLLCPGRGRHAASKGRGGRRHGLPSPMATGVTMDFHQPAKRPPIIGFTS